MHWLFNIILSLLTTYHTFAAGRCSHARLTDSTAESANYMLARDNHVVGVMSRCESNESRLVTFAVAAYCTGISFARIAQALRPHNYL